MVEKTGQTEGKEEYSLVILGHVNVGKSSFCGRLMIDLNMLTQREMDQYRAKARNNGLESWWLAFIMDSDNYEQSTGTTVEVGRKTIETATRKYEISDCPGHQKYAANMINNALLTDYAILIVSARKNEFESGFKLSNEDGSEGSTRQHLKILRASKCKKIIVAVNKMDDVDWSQDVFNERVTFIKNFAQGLFRESNIDDLFTFIPTSAIEGGNVVKPTNNWYQGKSVLDSLDSFPSIQRPVGDQLRIIVQESVQNSKGQNIYISKIEAGCIESKSEVFYFPRTLKTTVNSIYDMDMNEIPKAYAGQTVHLQLTDFEVDDVECQGIVLARKNDPPAVSSQLEIQLQTYQLPTGVKSAIYLTEGSNLNIHIHGLQMPCKITRIKDVINQQGQSVKNNIIRSLNRAVCVIQFEKLIAFEKSEHPLQYPFANFLLRQNNTTVGFGKILRYKPDGPKLTQV